jgi:TonB-dependent receptor
MEMKSRLKSRLKSWFCVLLGLAALSSAIPTASRADDAETAGVVTGRVLNPATKRYLNRVIVRVDGTNLVAITDQDGNYRLAGVAPGTHTIFVEYEDLDTTSATVTVRPGETITRDFELKSNVYQMETFVVAADREGQAAATQMQRAAVEGQYVMAADSFGNIQDGNVGELLRQLPGVTVFDHSGNGASAPGEANSIRIRGASDDMAAMVTIDGNAATSASPIGGAGREFSIKGFNVDNIESVEIFKAATPAHPGNSLGGLVNFTTRSAFQQKGRRIAMDFQFKFLAEDFGLGSRPLGSAEPARKFYPAVRLNYSEAFFQRTAHPLGIVFSFSASQTGRSGVNNTNGLRTYPNLAFGQPFDPDYPAIGASATWTQEDWITDTLQSALTLDYKLTVNSSAYVKLNWVDQRQVDGGTRQAYALAGAVDAGSDRDTIIAFANQSNYLRLQALNYKYDSRTYSVNPGMKHKWGEFSLTYDVYYSRTDMERNEKGLQYRLSSDSHDASNRVAYMVTELFNRDGATFIPGDGVDVTRAENYTTLLLIDRPSRQDEKKYGGKIDMKQGFLFHFPLILQAGAAYNAWEQASNRPTAYYQFTGDDQVFGSPDDPSLAQFVDYGWTGKFYWDDKVAGLPWLAPEQVWAYYQQHPDQFRTGNATPANTSPGTTNAYNMMMNDKEIKEEVTALYFQGTWRLGPLSVLTGARWERTKATLTGNLYDQNAAGSGTPEYEPDTEARTAGKFTRVTKNAIYDTWLPGIHLKYEPAKKIQFRGSVTRSIGRPSVNNLLPLEQINLTAAPITITRSNPDLLPQEGKNYDFSGEYYYNRNSYVGFSVFRKEQKNRARDVTTTVGTGPDNGFDGEYEGAYLTTKRSWGNVNIQGFELMGMHGLQFLPWKFKNLRFTWNYSYNEGKSRESPGAPWQDEVDGLPRKTANAALFYTGKRMTWQLRFNWRDIYTTNTQYWIGTEILRQQQRWEQRKNLDANITYKLTSQWQLYCDWQNITNDDQIQWDATGGIANHIRILTNVTLGLRANF